MRGPDGRVEAVLTLGQEVTDVVRARQEAEHYAEEQRKRSDFEQQLIGIVSHDLRNPLSAILLGTTVLARREDLDERTTKAVTRIQAAAERAVSILPARLKAQPRSATGRCCGSSAAVCRASPPDWRPTPSGRV